MSRVLFEDSVFDHGGVENFHEEERKSQEAQRGVEKIAATETKYLTISKVVVLLSICVAAGLVSAGTYIFLQQEEDDDYSNHYEHVTKTARDAVEFHTRNAFLAARSLSRTLTAEAITSDQKFPFVTYRSFETLGDSARAQGGFEMVFYEPIVQRSELELWNNYSVHNQGWMNWSRAAALSFTTGNLQPSDYVDSPIAKGIYFGIQAEGIDIPVQFAPAYGEGPYMPVWLQSPPPFRVGIINFDGYVTAGATMDAMTTAREAVIGAVQDLSSLGGNAITNEDHNAFHQQINDPTSSNVWTHPHTTLFQPVFKELNDETSDIVAILGLTISWDKYLLNLLPDGVGGLTCVLKNTCGQAYTYELDGNTARYMGEGDMHETKFDSTEVVLPFHDFIHPNRTTEIGGHCVYSYHVYATSSFEEQHKSSFAVALTVVVACTFFFMIGTFFFYDWFVKRRNTKVLDIAARTSAIVSSLFPSNVRDRLLGQGVKDDEEDGNNPGQRMKLKNFLQSEHEMDSSSHDVLDDDGLDPFGSKPIADIFPETTIIFADIVGFTAWSSAREPSQVFTLLETIYKAFDDVATRRRVFKVETVGDCYVAVCGLPDPRSDHAVVMARFARSCLRKMHDLVNKLELVLGPDTADLDMRIGLHSGPVTAGVLRGERARFQLFGDTMNTASRMESTGQKGRIQMSQETADLITAAGKGNWIFPREEQVHAKGKGTLQTYWLATESDQLRSSSIVGDVHIVVQTPETPVRLDKTERLVKWNVDLLLKLLKEVQSSRSLYSGPGSGAAPEHRFSGPDVEVRQGTVLDEVQEIIRLPNFTGNSSQAGRTADVEISPKVDEQLANYIGAIAMLYQENPFHNFEHASHVTMSVSKLMSRIIAPDLSNDDVNSGNLAFVMHDHTYGITSDPLTQFACVFSALIHDVDHSGVPNTQLAKENPQLAQMYGGRSIAEQNSVDLAWNLLMGPDYVDLRNAIYTTPAEEARFRQLVVNSVMATDIMDKDLKKLRNERWDRAFSTEANQVEESPKDVVDRKATIVIEHLIQASDVAHTMQHWHIYRKWNQKLYTELYEAYIKGRAEKDPAEFWYKGEIGFFDFYIIPLAKKLKDCGVFGVSSDEYYNYATKNRAEWEQRGREVVAEMIQEMNKLYPSSVQGGKHEQPETTPEQAPKPIV